MSPYTCTQCHTHIPAGEAVLRSVSLRRVAYHRDCAEVAGIWAATLADVITRHNMRVG